MGDDKRSTKKDTAATEPNLVQAAKDAAEAVEGSVGAADVGNDKLVAGSKIEGSAGSWDLEFVVGPLIDKSSQRVDGVGFFIKGRERKR